MMFYMMQSEATKGTIESILNQVDQTTIKIGHVNGKFISEGQIAAIREALNIRGVIQESVEELFASTSLDLDLESELRAERFDIAKEIKDLQFKIKNSDGAKAHEYNHILGKKLSRRSKIDKQLQQFN